MNKIAVYSEIGKLKTVLLHEPGLELTNLVPDYLEDFLFDDIPWLPLAKKEHQAFAQLFKDAGVKVVYLSDLVTEALDSNELVRNSFINDFVMESNINNEDTTVKLTNYLKSINNTKELVLKTMVGIKKSEIGVKSEGNPFITYPMPNLYFERDPVACVGDGVLINRMFFKTRCRETIYGRYIFTYHKDYKNVPKYYEHDGVPSIEGGDIMILNENTLLIGISQRTKLEAIRELAKNLFLKNETSFKTIIAFDIPKKRTFMHLDTVFTQVDKYKFLYYKECFKNVGIIKLTKNDNSIAEETIDSKFKDVLENILHHEVTLIPCGGDDDVAAAREQWSDGANSITLEPGEIIVYERNDITNQVLKDYGIKTHSIPSSELSRGRGGPRCMCMPLEREPIK